MGRIVIFSLFKMSKMGNVFPPIHQIQSVSYVSAEWGEKWLPVRTKIPLNIESCRVNPKGVQMTATSSLRPAEGEGWAGCVHVQDVLVCVNGRGRACVGTGSLCLTIA